MLNLQVIARSFIYVWHKNQSWFAFSIFKCIFTGILPLFTLLVSSQLINHLAYALQDHNSNGFYLVLILLILQFLIMLFSSCLENIQKYMDQRAQLLLDYDLKKLIFEKSESVPYAFFDIPDFYNTLNRISLSSGSRFLAPLTNTLQILSGLISITSFLIYLIKINWLLVLLSIVTFIPIIIIQLYFGRKSYKLFIKQTQSNREANYHEFLLTNRQPVKEIKLFQLSPFLVKRWAKIFKRNSNEKLFQLKHQQIAQIFTDILTGLLYLSSALLIIEMIRNGRIYIGQFIASGQAISGSQETIENISNNIASIYSDSLYLQYFFSFLDKKFPKPYDRFLTAQTNKESHFPQPITIGINFRDVSFRYPSSNHDSLKHINLCIKAGEKVAIVGQNGSGKSTLVKCLLGLYEPNNGIITIDNINLSNIDEKEIYDNETAIFQDFVRYSFTVKDNIRFGNIAKNNFESVVKAAKQVGLNEYIKNLREGYNTYLGKFIKDGDDLSGGQWQKLAIARAIYKGGQIMILDEPVASLDPDAETELYQYLIKLSRDRTTFFISHRLSAAKLADKIIVMKDGRVVELGSHQNLIELNGEYKRLLDKQNSWKYNYETRERSI